MTNREWLESLSDENLARTFIRLVNRVNALCQMCEYRYEECSTYDKQLTCTDGISKWLQSEHKDED